MRKYKILHNNLQYWQIISIMYSDRSQRLGCESLFPLQLQGPQKHTAASGSNILLECHLTNLTFCFAAVGKPFVNRAGWCWFGATDDALACAHSQLYVSGMQGNRWGREVMDKLSNPHSAAREGEMGGGGVVIRLYVHQWPEDLGEITATSDLRQLTQTHTRLSTSASAEHTPFLFLITLI